MHHWPNANVNVDVINPDQGVSNEGCAFCEGDHSLFRHYQGHKPVKVMQFSDNGFSLVVVTC